MKDRHVKPLENRQSLRYMNQAGMVDHCKDDESLAHAELLAQAQQVASEPKKHCRVTAARILQKWSAVKRIVTRLQKKCGVYDEQAIAHSALPFTIVSRVQVLHASRLRRVVRAFGKELGKILAPSPFLSPDIPCQTVHRVFRIALVRGEHVRIALGDPHSRCDQAAAFGFVAEFPTSSSQCVGQTLAPRYHPRR